MPNLEQLASEFFREFARHEYCLKAVGLRKSGKAAEADWPSYAREAEILGLFNNPQPAEFYSSAERIFSIVISCAALLASGVVLLQQVTSVYFLSRADLIFLFASGFVGSAISLAWFRLRPRFIIANVA